jgi:hypothetical protein
MKRRSFIHLSSAASTAYLFLPVVFPSFDEDKMEFKVLYDKLRPQMLDSLEKSKVTFGKSLLIHSPDKSRYYNGLWPDDFLYPMLVEDGLYEKEMLTAIASFLTDSIVDLEVFPDRIESDGMPVMQPGVLARPHAHKMPLHLPAAWIRLIDNLEHWGAEISRKEDWATIFKRSIDSISFSGGLAYVDPQHPHVGFGFHDPEAITGFELMSSLVLFFGLKRAAHFFKGYIKEEEIKKWQRLSEGIPKNLWRLFDEEKGAYLAGSKDCRQINVWANGLAYWITTPDIQKSIVQFYKDNRHAIFYKGFTRQIAEPGGWQRHLVPHEVGMYTNGGFWSVGTGWILSAIADQDPGFAIEIARELVETLAETGYSEYISSTGSGAGAAGFLAALAVPMMGLKAIIEEKPFSDFF